MMMMRGFLRLLFLSLLAALSYSSATTTFEDATTFAAVPFDDNEEGDHRDAIQHRKLFFGSAGTRIRKQYIVQFRDDLSADDVTGFLAHFLQDDNGDDLPNVLQTYTHALRGALIGRLGLRFLKRLLDDDAVLRVEEDVQVEAQAIQRDAPWGLDRVDQTFLPLDGTYTYGQTGEGVIAYVFDSGIDATHPEFEGRASCGLNTFLLGSCDDQSGHGTAVAATLGGATFGVAKGITIEAVKVLNRFGMGMASNVLQGFDYVAQRKEEQPDTPMIVNLSLHATGFQFFVETAITLLTAQGVTVVGAAGNQFTDACLYSPANMAQVITVGATDRNDVRAATSNYGPCVDLFAPGVDVNAAVAGAGVMGGPGLEFSGTSKAVPYVVGAAAIYLQDFPNATPAAVKAFLQREATPAVVQNAGLDSPNLLLHIENVGTASPTDAPSLEPTLGPTAFGSSMPSLQASSAPSGAQSATPTEVESAAPSLQPTADTSQAPSFVPTWLPTVVDSAQPSLQPSLVPTLAPTGLPTGAPAETLIIQINTGSATEDYLAMDGTVWIPDIYNTAAGVYTENVRGYANTEDDTLYQTDHATTDGPLIYEIPLLYAGVHRIDLHFAEMENPPVGQRVMDVYVQDQLVLDDFDIRAVAPRNSALIVPVLFTATGDRDVLKIEFQAVASFPAKVNAIGVYQLEAKSNMPTTAPTQSAAPTLSPRDWSSETQPPTGVFLPHDKLDKFGTSVAVSGDYLVIGSPKDGQDLAGRVLYYKKEPNFDVVGDDDFNQWNLLARLAYRPQRAGDFFGQVVAMHGSTLVVSSRTSINGFGGNLEDGFEGAVSIYKLNILDRFVHSQTFEQDDIDSTDRFDYFGASLSIYENTLVIGSMKQDAVMEIDGGGTVTAFEMGAVHIYTRPNEGSDFANPTVLYASDVDTAMEFSKFGRSVKVFGNKLVVGSQDSASSSSAGAVYVLERPDELSPFVPTGKLVLGGKQDYMGWSVDVNDDYIVVGAVGAAKAYLFSAVAPYPLIATLTPNNAVDQGYPSKFGSSVALGDGIVVVGAPRGDGLVTDSGTVHVFWLSPNSGQWEEEVELNASNGARLDRFGYAVAAQGTNVVVGAPHNDDFGPFAGLVYSYLPQE